MPPSTFQKLSPPLAITLSSLGNGCKNFLLLVLSSSKSRALQLLPLTKNQAKNLVQSRQESVEQARFSSQKNIIILHQPISIIRQSHALPQPVRSIPPPNTVDSEIVSVASILPRLTCSLYHQCIVLQRALITNLIGKYNATKEVGCILAVHPNRVWYKNLEELLNEEEVIYEIIFDQVNEYKYLFYTRVLPNSPFKEITCSRDDISEDGA